jgi:hypothetical protein
VWVRLPVTCVPCYLWTTSLEVPAPADVTSVCNIIHSTSRICRCAMWKNLKRHDIYVPF